MQLKKINYVKRTHSETTLSFSSANYMTFTVIFQFSIALSSEWE